MKYVSTFSGIGGFDLGFDRAGMECQAQVEIDLFALEVLGKHWPDVPKYRDIRKFNYEQHGLEKGTIDLVCGGFPCQDLSIAGRREGLAGERSRLYFEFHRIITEFQPKWVVIENVPGLLNSNGGKDFAIVIGGLTGIVPEVPKGGWGGTGFFRGPVYKVAYRILDAQYFGVAQRRRRVFIVASLTDGRAAKVLFECEGMSRNTPPRREEGQGFAGTAGTLAASGGGLDRPAGNANELDFCIPTSFDWQSRGDVRLNVSDKPMLQSGQTPAVLFDGRNMDTHEQSPTLQAKKQGYLPNYIPMVFGGGNTSGPIDVATRRNVKGDTRLDFDTETFVVWDKLQETSVAHKTKPQGELNYTLNKAGQMMVGVRRLTPTECARLQGFPDDHNDFLSDAQRYRQFGNAVAVPVAEWLGNRIVQVEYDCG